ncbi:MAG: RecX family transcriptional regulator [Acholeplasmatales bacterium]|nr:RecX family transcriptional regulator [Acholeplasmatales bacterium]
MIELKDIKKKKDKYILNINDNEIEVFEEVIIKFMLLKKREIDDNEYKEILDYIKYTDSLHLAITYLKKPRTTYEVKKYLKDLKLYDEKIIKKLLDMGLLNDRIYTDMYVDYQSRINLKGPKLIKKELEIKGVHLDFEYPNYEENVKKIIDRYLKNNKDKPTKMLNYGLNNYLIAKGFDKCDEYFYNEDRELIKKDIDKLLIKNKKLEGYKLKQKLYTSLINKGYESSLINEFIDKL